MDAERFQTLAGAYGGDLTRWPLTDQPQARAFMADNRHAAGWLAEASLLDSLLDTAPEGPQNDLLRERIIRSAPKPMPAPVAANKPARWASWAGLAAACVAGVLAGAHTTANKGVFGDQMIEATVEASTAFADSPFSESLGETG